MKPFRAWHARAWCTWLSLVGWMSTPSCNHGDLIIGDDTRDGGAAEPADAQSGADADTDARADASSELLPCPDFSGQCIASGTACRTIEPRGSCPVSDARCCTEACPSVAPPDTSSCLGTPPVATYDPTGCVIAYACAPVDCVAAGGLCVSSEHSCAKEKLANSQLYSCGLDAPGPLCCLP